jgi:hypothetical protein
LDFYGFYTFYSHLQFQFATTMEDDGRESEMLVDEDTASILKLVKVVRDTAGLTHPEDSYERLRSDLLWEEIKSASLHFLRCAALFYHHLVEFFNF